MSERFSNKATFYDLFCYWISGFSLLGVILLYGCAFFPQHSKLLLGWLELSKWSYFVVVVLGYVSGHLANALSSLIVEQWLFHRALLKKKSPFAKAQQDISIPDSGILPPAKARAKVMIASFESMFGYNPTDDSRRELRLIAQKYLGGVPMSGMNYMAYYGLNRVLFVVSFIAILPLAMILVDSGASVLCVGVIVVLCTLMSCAFLWQYWRFVGKYSDFLASLILLVKLADS